jgi:MFS family permease
MYLGQVVVGLGGESFVVANSVLLSEWFIGKELAFSFGACLAISKLGSVMTNILSPMLTDKISFDFAIWFGCFLVLSAIICILLIFPIEVIVNKEISRNQQIYSLLDNKQEEQENIIHGDGTGLTIAASPVDDEEGALSSSSAPENPRQSVEGSEETKKNIVRFSDVYKLSHMFWVLCLACGILYSCVVPFNYISSALLLERDYFQAQSSSCQLTYPTQCESSSNPPISCSSSRWYQPPIPLNYTSSYPTLATSDIDCTDDYWKESSNCATSTYCSRLIDGENIAAVIMSIPFIISACLSPVFGYLIDNYGYRAVIFTISSAVLVMIHCYLGFTKVDPVGPMVGQGLAFTAFASALWPSIPLVVESRLQGLAFGITFCVLNFTTLVVPLFVAYLYQINNDSYLPYAELCFAIFAGLGFLIGCYMNYYDYFYQNHILNGATAEFTPLIEETSPRNSVSSHKSLTLEENDQSTRNILQKEVTTEVDDSYQNIK